MFRTSRTIAALIRHLMLGTAVTVSGATLTMTLVSCQDESQPEYWVKKLDQPKWRSPAIKRLDQFYQDALTKAGNKADDPAVKALLDKTVDPLTKAYVDGYADLDTKTRVMLIKLLASFRDKRTEPALKKALEEFVKKPATKEDEQDIKWVVRAQGDLKLPGLNGPLVEVFQKLKTSSMLGGITYKDLNECMLANADKAWAEPLKKMLEAEIVPPDQKKPGSVEEYKDQLFWQTVSAQILGELRDASAVELLLKVILDPAKGDVAQTALLALVKIGQPAVDAAVKLLKGEDKKLVDFHTQKLMKVGGLKEPPKDDPHVKMAAIVLGMAGSPAAIKPIIEVMNATEQKANKAILLSELSKITATDESKTAFKAGFEGLDLDVSIPGGGKALPVLVSDAVTRFYDSTMVDWVLERGKATKGYPDDLKDLRATMLITALKLAKPDQMAAVKAMLPEWGTKQTDAKSKYKFFEEPMFEQAEDVLKACGDRVACYLSTIEKSESQDKDTQFKGIKCAYMLAIFGNDKTAAEIVERMESLENAAVRFTAAQAVDFLLPKGSEELANKLDAIIEKNKKTADKDKMAGDAPLRQVMYRIRARAGK